MVVNHQIKSQIFDTSFLGDQSESHILYIRLKQLYYDEILKVIEDCFDQYDQEDYSLIIDRLELDLGEMYYHEIDTEFPVRLKENLKEKLKDVFIHKRGVFVKREHLVSSENLVIGFLEDGYLESSDNRVLDESLQESIAAGNIVKILNAIKHNQRAKRRFLKRVSREEIIKIIQLIAPNGFNYIKAFYNQISDKNLPVIAGGSSESDQSLQLLRIIFDYVVSVGDSYFNSKEFTRKIINSIAVKYNISILGLIEFLIHNIEKTNKSYRDKLLQILNEIGGSLLDAREINIRSRKLNKYNWKQSFFNQLVDGDLKTLFKNTDAELMRNLVFHHGDEVIEKLIRLKQKAKFFELFVRKYERSEVNHLIARMEPGSASLIFQIHGSLFNFHDASRFVNDSSGNFKQNILKLTLMILIVNRGSRFNQKVFVTNLIQKTASHYNRSYQELLLDLNKSCLQWSQFMPNAGQFVSIIEELYQESSHDLEKSWLKKVDISQTKLNAFNELNIIKILNNKSLYDSISSWKLQYVLNEFFKANISKEVWEQLWDSLSKQQSLYKFFIAASSDHFQKMIANINADNNVREAHSLITNILTRLFSPSHKSYLVTLDVKLFELLLQNRIKSIHQSDLLAMLLESILPIIPVSTESFLSELNNETLPREFKKLIVSKKQELMNQSKSVLPANYMTDLLGLIKGTTNDFSVVGYSGIVQLVADVSLINKSMLIEVFGQLSLAEMKSFIHRNDEVLLDNMIKVFESDYHYSFSNFLRLSSESLNRNRFNDRYQVMRSFKEIILLSIYKKSEFKVRKLVNKLYGIIKNSKADFLFDLPTLSLPTHGNIHINIEALETVVSGNMVAPSDKEVEDKEVIKKLIKMEEKNEHLALDEPLFLHNAGLVLLHPYLSHLFDRVGLFEDGDFKSLKARKEAAIYLNYILLNDQSYDEENLTLNKILCGLNIDEIIDLELDITDVMKNTAISMLDAFINHWSKISNSTHDGVRGAWFWREGKLLVKDDSFELTVEQKAYDILMDDLPFSLSHITYSWMKRPVYVNWR